MTTPDIEVSPNPATFDNRSFRHVLGHYPTGVCVITSVDSGGTPVGMVVGTFNSASLDPPLVCFFPDRRSASWNKISTATHFCVNVLAGDQVEMCHRFSARSDDKFAGLNYRFTPHGTPVLPQVLAWIECRLHETSPVGDHDLAVGYVLDMGIERATTPLLFFQSGFGDFSHHAIANDE